MAQLRREHQGFVDRDAEVVVVGPEGPDAFARYWSEHDLPFVGLPDPQHSVLKLYGQEVKLLKFGRMPAQLIIDRAGVVRFVHYGSSMKDIPDSAELFGILDELDAGAHQGDDSHERGRGSHSEGLRMISTSDTGEDGRPE